MTKERWNNRFGSFRPGWVWITVFILWLIFAITYLIIHVPSQRASENWLFGTAMIVCTLMLLDPVFSLTEKYRIQGNTIYVKRFGSKRIKQIQNHPIAIISYQNINPYGPTNPVGWSTFYKDRWFVNVLENIELVEAIEKLHAEYVVKYGGRYDHLSIESYLGGWCMYSFTLTEDSKQALLEWGCTVILPESLVTKVSLPADIDVLIDAGF